MFRELFICVLVGLASTQSGFGSNLNSIFGSTTCCQHNEIQVSGSGSAFGQPDIATISVRFQASAQSSVEAVRIVSTRVNELISVLGSNGIPQGDYEVLSINVFNDYFRGQIIGKKASQTIRITFRNLDADGANLASLIDDLAKINTIVINSVSFDIFDKTKLQKEAREAAFEDAKQKAQDYADAAGVNVGSVITIIDGQFDEAPPARFQARAFAVAADSSSTQVPIGEQEVKYNIKVTFGLGLSFS